MPLAFGVATGPLTMGRSISARISPNLEARSSVSLRAVIFAVSPSKSFCSSAVRARPSASARLTMFRAVLA